MSIKRLVNTIAVIIKIDTKPIVTIHGKTIVHKRPTPIKHSAIMITHNVQIAIFILLQI